MATNKCIKQLPAVRLTDVLFNELNELAARDDRSLSDYVRRVLTLHVYGHAGSIAGDSDADNENRA